MFFNSLPIIFLFLPLVVTGYFLIGGRKQGQVFLAAASLIFYFLLIPEYLSLLLVSITFNYIIGSLLIRSQKSPDLLRFKSTILLVGILGDLGLLGYYKYFNFLTGNIDAFFGFDIPLQQIILSLGISFFTLTHLAIIIMRTGARSSASAPSRTCSS